MESATEKERKCREVKQTYLRAELKNKEEIKKTTILPLIPSPLCQHCPSVKIEPGTPYFDDVGTYWKLICGVSKNEGKGHLHNTLPYLIEKKVSL